MHHNKQYEREFVRLMTKLGITCFRIAGSGAGEEAVSDCILYLPEPCVVEVKKTKEELLYMRQSIKEQLERMVAVCMKDNLIPLLAIKFKYRGWNIIKVDELKNISFDKERCIDETVSKDNLRAFIRLQDYERNTAGNSR